MALSNHDQAQIREYLLGKLSDEEQQKIEERLMVEDELFDEFEVSKDELIEEYCAGELGQNERHWFESHFLASTEGTQRHAFALAMDRLQHPQPEPVVDVAPEPKVAPLPGRQLAFFGPLQALIKTQPWAFAAASVVFVLLVAFVVTRLIPRPEGQTFTSTLTSNAINRGEGPLPTKIKLPPNTSTLKLRLLLPKPGPANTSYQAELDDRISRKSVKVEESDGESVTVEIPSELVPRGEYSLLLHLTNPNGTEQQLSYRFNVE